MYGSDAGWAVGGDSLLELEQGRWRQIACVLIPFMGSVIWIMLVGFCVAQFPHIWIGDKCNTDVVVFGALNELMKEYLA